MTAWLARASSASVSSVMKFCATQPGLRAAMLSFSSVALASVRKVLASSAVGAEDGFGGPPGALTFEQAIAIASWRTTVARGRSLWLNIRTF